MKQWLELLVVAMRALTADGDDILKSEGLGRAHARALVMIGRRPSLSVADLLGLLHITKQSLNRVLGELMEKTYVEQRVSPQDRRKRLLILTEKGRALDEALWNASRARVTRAFREAGPESVAGFRKVLAALSPEPKR